MQPVPARVRPVAAPMLPGDACDTAILASPLVACGIVVGGHLVHATAGLRRMFGLGDAADTLPMPFALLLAAQERHRVQTILDEAVVGQPPPLPVEFLGERRGDTAATGSMFYGQLRIERTDVDGHPALLVQADDVTRRRIVERQLHALAMNDALTGLPNRILLAERAAQALAGARAGATLAAILVIDLDGFKQVNDTHGHRAGDAVLKAVAARLAQHARSDDTVARLGGDEFVVVLPHIDRREDAALVASRALRQLADPVSVDGTVCSVGASIGIAVFPEDGTDFDTLFARADAAMYASKHRGRNCLTYADASTRAVMEFASDACRTVPGVGVKIMDEQHAELVRLMGEVGAALRDATGGAALASRMRELMAYAEFHFATEEALMSRTGYAGLAEHRAMHRNLLDDLASLCATIDRQSTVLALRHLAEWLLRHADTADREAAAALGAYGIG